MLINHYSIIQLFKFLNIHFRIISIERYTFDARKLLPLPTKNMVVGKCFQTVKRFPIRIPDFHGCFVLKISFTGLHLPNKNLLHNKKADQSPLISEQQIVSQWNCEIAFSSLGEEVVLMGAQISAPLLRATPAVQETGTRHNPLFLRLYAPNSWTQNNQII